MYEKLLLESGKVFEGRRVSGIGANVVDDTETITIPVLIPEGLAYIVSVAAPSSFTPGVAFDITVKVTNIGTYADEMFVNIDNTTPGYAGNIGSMHQTIAKNATYDFVIPVTLVQEIDLSALIEAGHVED